MSMEEEEGVEIRVSEQELLRAVADRAPMMTHHSDSEVMMGRRRRRRDFNSMSSSDESVIVVLQSPFTPLPLTTRPACFSPKSTSNSASPEEEEIYNKLKSSDIFDQEQGLIMMRKMTRTKDKARVSLGSSSSTSLSSTISSFLIDTGLSGNVLETKRQRFQSLSEEKRGVLMGLAREEDLWILGSEGVWIRVVLKPSVAIERGRCRKN